jgi:CheY-like chemotaxis protein
MVTDRRILLVEDDELTRSALAVTLQSQGYTVSCAANGQEAIEQLRQGPLPQLILLDLMMPVMDGWRFRREQTRDPGLASIPVVIVSADSALSERAALLEVSGYLEKPIDPGQLIDAVRQHV